MRCREATGTPPSMSSLSKHSRSEKQVPLQGAREAWHSGENHPKSTFYCRELVCCHVQRPQQHEGLWLLFLFHFIHFHFYGFPFFLCAVDAFFLLQFQTTWSYMEIVHRQNCFAALQGPRGRSPGPPSRVEMHRRMGIALATSSFGAWTEELMAIIFRDCKDHVDYVTGGQRGYKPFCTNACPPAHSSIQEYATGGLSGPTCRLSHVTWPNCMPRAYRQASIGQPCLLLYLGLSPPSFLFLTICSPPEYTPCPAAAPRALGEWIRSGYLLPSRA